MAARCPGGGVPRPVRGGDTAGELLVGGGMNEHIVPWATTIADALENGRDWDRKEIAAHLRRLHAENKRLETLCYDYLGELTAMRAVEHMRKQRKPLTDEEIDALWNQHRASPNWLVDLTRAIERAHGIEGEA